MGDIKVIKVRYEFIEEYYELLSKIFSDEEIAEILYSGGMRGLYDALPETRNAKK